MYPPLENSTTLIAITHISYPDACSNLNALVKMAFLENLNFITIYILEPTFLSSALISDQWEAKPKTLADHQILS